MSLPRHGLVCTALFLCFQPPAQSAVTSVFTDVACKPGKPAKIVKKRTKNARKAQLAPVATVCPNVAGFSLRVVHKQGRSTVNIIAPDRRIFPLNYWDVVSVGGKAEWRVSTDDGKAAPIGLIIPVKTDRALPVLAVAKVGRHTACVVRHIDPQAPGALDQARQHADGTAEICMQRPSLAAADR